MTSLDEARDSIVRHGRALSEAGLSPGTTGNLSVRVGDVFLSTPTAVGLGSLELEDLSVLSATGELLSGRRPTKETFMHLAMYRASSEIGAVVHLHSSYATAVSCLDGIDETDAIPVLTPYLTMKGGPVRVLPYFAPGDAGVAEPVAESVGAGHRVLLLSNHGSLVGGRDLASAVTIAQELEEAAKIMLITAGLSVRRLSAEQRATLDEMRVRAS